MWKTCKHVAGRKQMLKKIVFEIDIKQKSDKWTVIFLKKK